MNKTKQKLRPLTFKQCMKMVERGERNFEAVIGLMGCYSRKVIYYRNERSLDIFHFISESEERFDENKFNEYFSGCLFFAGWC